MGWYEAIKDGIAVAQKMDNIPLVQSLMDAQKQIFDLLEENHHLKEEVTKMKEIENIACKIERHDDAYITLSDDPEKHIYCSNCWDSKRVLVQGQKTSTGAYHCPACGNNGFYNKKAYEDEQQKAIDSMAQSYSRGNY